MSRVSGYTPILYFILDLSEIFWIISLMAIAPYITPRSVIAIAFVIIICNDNLIAIL